MNRNIFLGIAIIVILGVLFLAWKIPHIEEESDNHVCEHVCWNDGWDSGKSEKGATCVCWNKPIKSNTKCLGTNDCIKNESLEGCSKIECNSCCFNFCTMMMCGWEDSFNNEEKEK